MKDNYELCLVGEKIVLFPYRPEHVPKYHEWMKDPELLEATGSEPLTLMEEIDMQQSWKDDPKKCTFIVHHCYHSSSSSSDSTPSSRRETTTVVQEQIDDNDTNKDEKKQRQQLNVVDNLNSMVGDVNLFLSDYDYDDDNDIMENDDERQQNQQQQAEIDIMIATKYHKRKGLGKEATSIMLCYGITIIPNLRRYFCKINEDNTASIELFKNLGFVQCDYVECFKQVELELRIITKEELIEKLHPYGQYKQIQCPL